jgi:hypothetical protein
VLTSARPLTTSQVTLPDWNAVVVGASVGVIMEMKSLSVDRLLLLGPLQVIQSGTRLSLPPSRKVRALFAYLAMAPRPCHPRKAV